MLGLVLWTLGFFLEKKKNGTFGLDKCISSFLLLFSSLLRLDLSIRYS